MYKYENNNNNITQKRCDKIQNIVINLNNEPVNFYLFYNLSLFENLSLDIKNI